MGNGRGYYETLRVLYSELLILIRDCFPTVRSHFENFEISYVTILSRYSHTSIDEDLATRLTQSIFLRQNDRTTETTDVHLH